MRKIVVSLNYWKKCCKMNKTIYFYPKFLEFQIMCRGPQLTPSQAGCEFETPGVHNVTNSAYCRVSLGD